MESCITECIGDPLLLLLLLLSLSHPFPLYRIRMWVEGVRTYVGAAGGHDHTVRDDGRIIQFKYIQCCIEKK